MKLQVTPLYVIAIFFTILLAMDSIVLARHHHHHHKSKRARSQEADEYEYRDLNDYSSGIFVDSVPIKTTDSTKDFQKTNRFPKLRKFFDSRRFYQKK